MALNFPTAPTTGQTHDATNGIRYIFDGVKWITQGSNASGLKDIVKLDSITSQFNGTLTTFDLKTSGTTVKPFNAETLTISLGGVIQEPQTAYTVDTNAGTITFASAPPTGIAFYGLLNSRAPLSTGTLSDGAVTNAKVNATAAIDATKLAFTQTGTGATARTVDSKLKEVVSVKDFGAVGNGTTDDTVAIQAAFNSISNYSSVFFPTGTYLLSANVTATNKKAILNGATFTGGFDIQTDFIESFEQWINGDDVTGVNKKGSIVGVGTPAIGTEYNKGGLLVGAGHSTNNTGAFISCDGATNWLSVVPNKPNNPQELIVYNSGLSGYANAVSGGGVINKVSGESFPAPYTSDSDGSTNKLIGDQFYFLRKVFKIKAVNSATQVEVEEEDKSAVNFSSDDAAETEAYTYSLTSGSGTATVTGTSVKYVSGDPFVPTFFNRSFKFSLTGKVTEFNITQANITEANPAVFTFNGHGLQNGDTLKYTANGTQPLITTVGGVSLTTVDSFVSNATVFSVLNRTDNTFQLGRVLDDGSVTAAVEVTNDGSDGQVFSINVTFVDPSEYTLGSAVGNGTYNFEWKGNINDQLSTLRVQAIAGSNEENVNIIAYGGNNFLGRYYSFETGFAGIGKFRPLFIGSGDYDNNAGYAHNIGCYSRDASNTRPTLQLGGVQGRHSVAVFGPANGVPYANRFEIEGAAANFKPAIRTKGTDANVGFGIDTKGNGELVVSQDFARTLFRVFGDASQSVNFLSTIARRAGQPVEIFADGGDTNIDFKLQPKGTGVMQFGVHTSSSDAAVSGYITIKDAAGNTRKLAVIS